MSDPKDPKDPKNEDHPRPRNKATMDGPQEEFIESTHVDDEKAHEELIEETDGPGSAGKSRSSE